MPDEIFESENEDYQSSGDEWIPSHSSDDCKNTSHIIPTRKEIGESSNTKSPPIEEYSSDVGEQQTVKAAKKHKGNNRQVNQIKRMKGEGYTGISSANTNTKQERSLGPTCKMDSCRHSKVRFCNEFTESDRQEIFQEFWKNMNWDQKRVYVSTLVDFHKTKNEASKRKIHYRYHLKKGGSRIAVCRSMFLNTLAIGEWSVHHWTTSSRHGMHTEISQLSTPKRSNSDRFEAKRQSCVDFLNSLPRLPSHYCRSSSSCKYLESMIDSKAQLHRLYLSFCEEKCVENPASKTVLIEEMDKQNLKFFQPKKDRCDTCCAHEVGNITEDVYQEHIKRKEEARTEKATDKLEAERGEANCISMDMQAVLITPRLNASALYYKQKLACHNFTVFNMKDSSVVCYFWHECEGSLNANVFASCLTDYIEKELPFKDKLTIFSDGCTYQNRNCILSNALLQLAIDKNMTITQKYLEKGHTQMEVDSVHAMIEKNISKKEIYSPANYVDLIKSAKKSNPFYKVKYLDHTFFKDYSVYQHYTIRCLKYDPNGTIYYKFLHGDEFKELPNRRKRSVRTVSEEIRPSQMFENSLPITAAKYRNLQDLLNVLPNDYHGFYKNLPHE